MDIEKEREAFENHLKKMGKTDNETFSKNEDDSYQMDIIHFGWKIWQAAKSQAVPEGYVLIPKKMPDEVNDHLWDFMTDNFVCTNDYGDSFMACDDFNLDKFYAELVKAQEPAND